MNLKNKKVLITGATGGIGKALVDRFHYSNFNIVASGTNNEMLKFLDFYLYTRNINDSIEENSKYLSNHISSILN